jgi:hypothetical protein
MVQGFALPSGALGIASLSLNQGFEAPGFRGRLPEFCGVIWPSDRQYPLHLALQRRDDSQEL